MKTIYLVRHAKSSWDHPELNDEQRPLLTKGIKKTMLICEYLKEHHISVDRLVSSHAVRAFETARIIASSLAYPENSIIIERKIYEEGVPGYYEAVYGLTNSIESVMIFGHNPGITAFANKFIPEKIDNIVTSGIVCISFNTELWEKIDLVESKLIFYTIPKQLKHS